MHCKEGGGVCTARREGEYERPEYKNGLKCCVFPGDLSFVSKTFLCHRS